MGTNKRQTTLDCQFECKTELDVIAGQLWLDELQICT